MIVWSPQKFCRRHLRPVSQFISEVWKAFCTSLCGTTSLTSGFHPLSNVQTEKTNQFLKTFLHCMSQMTWIPRVTSYLGLSMPIFCPFPVCTWVPAAVVPGPGDGHRRSLGTGPHQDMWDLLQCSNKFEKSALVSKLRGLHLGLCVCLILFCLAKP